MSDNDLLRGQSEIAEYLGMSESWLKLKLPELRQCGAVFTMIVGKPKRREVRAWKSVLMAWTIRKAASNEPF